MNCWRNQTCKEYSSRNSKATSLPKDKSFSQEWLLKTKKSWKVNLCQFRINYSNNHKINNRVQHFDRHLKSKDRHSWRIVTESPKHRISNILQRQQQSLQLPRLLCRYNAKKRWKKLSFLRHRSSDRKNIKISVLIRLLHESASKTTRSENTLWSFQKLISRVCTDQYAQSIPQLIKN